MLKAQRSPKHPSRLQAGQLYAAPPHVAPKSPWQFLLAMLLTLFPSGNCLHRFPGTEWLLHSTTVATVVQWYVRELECALGSHWQKGVRISIGYLLHFSKDVTHLASKGKLTLGAYEKETVSL